MALGPKRVTRITESPFPHEKAGQEAIRLSLPDVDPYHLWTNALLVDGSRSYEIDAIVLGKHCLYVLELKAWEGEIRGDTQDWYVLHRGREKYHPNPLRLLETKAKVIKSRLQAKLGDRVRLPWVEPLVFLHGKDVKLRFDEHTRGRVVVGDAIGAALTMRKYDGAPSYTGEPINRPLMEELKRGIRALGLKASEKNNRVGDYRIVGQLEDGELYQDLLVTKPDLGGRDIEYRLRVFPTEMELEPTRRAQIERAAVREERGLREVSGHPYVLQAQPGFPTPRGLAIPMEHVPDAVTLFTWVEARPGASLELRLRVLQQLCEAVAHCHSRRVVHRNLSPSAVLVSGGDDPKVHLRNFNFAHRLGSQATLTSAAGSDRDRLYRAPEAFVSAEAANEPADIFSLGTIAFFVLSGRDPARDLRERHALLQAGRGLRLGSVLDAFVAGRGPVNELGTAAEIEEVVATATDEDPSRRWPAATEFLNELMSAATEPPSKETSDGTPARVDPLRAKPGDELAPDLVVERVLGSGATSVVYLVRVGEALRVLKVARDARAAEFLRGEARTLENIKHQRIVALKRPIFSVGDHEALLLDMAGETTLAEYLREEGAATLDFASRWGRELLETVKYLEEDCVGVFHRDLKPANIGLEVIGRKQQRSILLFDFSHSHLPLSMIEAGTEAYRDPHLASRQSWDHHAEHYSAALVLYELVTGTLPRRPRTPSEPAQIAPEALVESCRDRLVRFFERAFAVDASDRFLSAGEMLQAWIEATSPGATVSRGRRTLEDAAPDTPIYELPLSESARNALDRNRIYTAAELARLPRNRLLILKGVGRKTAHELADVAQRLRERFQIEANTPLPEPLVPDFPPEPRALTEDPGPLPPDAVARLIDADVTNDVQLAGQSRVDLLELLRDEELVTAVKAHLEERRKKLGRSPGTLAGWVEEARRGLPRTKKDRALLERLLGLQPFGALGPAEAPMQVELARATEGVSQAKLSRLLLNARHQWLGSHLGRLVSRLAVLTHHRGGALPLPVLARRLVEDLAPADAGNPSPEAIRQAAFLVRVACETAGDSDPPALWRRIRSGKEIVEAVEDHWPVLQRLVKRVDDLARERPLPSVERTLAVVEDEVARQRLNARLAGSPPPDASRPDDAPPDPSPSGWLRVAVELSEVAALSRRGEVYPRDLEPVRQIELLQPALPPQFTCDDVRALARERYPAAPPLPPDDAALRGLLEPRGWVWDEGLKILRRRQEGFVTQYRSSVPTTPRAIARPSLEAERLDVDLVTERLASAARERTFRALMVAPQRVDSALQRVSRVIEQTTGQAPTVHSVDLALTRHMRRLLEQDFPGQDLWSEVLRADACGPDVTGPERESWDELLRYAIKATEAFLDQLAADNPPGRAIVLRDLGLVVRFRLAGFLDALVARVDRDERLGSVFLMVVQTEAVGVPRILDLLDVPATPGQSLRLHKGWVDGPRPAWELQGA